MKMATIGIFWDPSGMYIVYLSTCASNLALIRHNSLFGHAS